MLNNFELQLSFLHCGIEFRKPAGGSMTYNMKGFYKSIEGSFPFEKMLFAF